MSLVENIRKFLLSRAAKASAAKKDYPGFEKVGSIGLVFTSGGDNRHILDFSEKLKQAGKNVELLGYVPQKRNKLEKEPPFPNFTQSEINWYGKPSSKVVSEFLDRHYEVFISLNAKSGSPLEFVSATVEADLRIGLDASGFTDFDLVIRSGKPDGLRSAFSEIEYYLTFINKDEKAAV